MRSIILGLALLTVPALCRAADEARDKPFLVLNTGGHSAPIASVLFTPDGKQVLSVSEDRTIRFWDYETGELLRTLRPPVGPGHEGSLYAADIDPDGKTLAVGGFGYPDGKTWSAPLFLIDLKEYHVRQVLKGHTGAINALKYSRDGKRLASAGGVPGSKEHVVRVWDVSTGESRELKGHTAPIHTLAVAPDGKRLVSGSEDGTVRIWSAETGEQLVKIDTPGGQNVAWSPDGKTIAACTAGPNFIRLYDEKGKEIKKLTNPQRGYTWIHTVTFTADSKELMYNWVHLHGGEPGREPGTRGVSFYDLASGRFRHAFAAGSYWNYAVMALSPDGERVASTGGNDHDILVWQRRTGKVLRRLGGQGRTAFRVGWSPKADQPLVAWASSDPRTGVAPPERPPDRAFHLTELSQYGKTELETLKNPLEQFQQEQKSLEGRQLSRLRSDVTRVRITGKGLPRPVEFGMPGRPVHTFTLAPGKRVAVGGWHYLHLHDLGKPKPGEPAQVFQDVTSIVWASAVSPDGRYLVAALNDQTLRFWRLDRPEPLLTLFVAGNEWIAWTAQGYYAASPGGERFMGWQVNNGLDELGTFHAASQFRKTYYRPDVITLLLPKGSLTDALEAADNKKTKATAVEEVLPPKVQITAPASGNTRATEATLEVKVDAQGVSGHKIEVMQLLLDGRPYRGLDGKLDTPSDKVSKAWTVELKGLPAGSHRLEVVARTEVSLAVSREVTIDYQPAAAPPASADPCLHVLAIGINEYAEADLRLSYCAKDAQELAALLESKSLFKVGTKQLILNQEATREKILAALDDLQKRMRPQDVAVVSYSGHGGNDKGKFFLVPVEFDSKKVKDTALWGEQFKEKLEKTPGRVILLLDACHSGAIGGVAARAALGANDAGRAVRQADRLARDLADESSGVVVMCAAMHNQLAQEKPTLKHGVFTKALIEGLTGKADYNQDGKIHLTELDLWVDQRVAELSRDGQHAVAAKPTSFRPFNLTRVK
jgi:WD40 repeat protein